MESVVFCLPACDFHKAQWHNNLGNAHFDQGKLDEAIAAYKEAVDIKPDAAEAYNNLGAAYLKQGKLDKAIVAFKKAVHIDSRFVDAYYLLADVYSIKGERSLSLKSLEKAMDLERSYMIDPVLISPPVRSKQFVVNPSS